MWVPYFNAVTANILDVKILFDRIHIIKLMKEPIDEARQALYHYKTFPDNISVIKGTHLLLKSLKNLNDEKDERKLLAQAIEIKRTLGRFYWQYKVPYS